MATFGYFSSLLGSFWQNTKRNPKGLAWEQEGFPKGPDAGMHPGRVLLGTPGYVGAEGQI